MKSSDDSSPMIRLAVVTNIPAPYRVSVFNIIASLPGVTLRVLYASRSEPDRQWELPDLEHDHVFLTGHILKIKGKFIHFSSGVSRELKRFEPDVVLTTGFNPTHLMACWWSVIHRRRHVVMTDGTDISESGLSLLHRMVRRLVFSTTQAFVVAAEGGVRLLRSYGVEKSRIHRSPLCANASVNWSSSTNDVRDLDILFSGRMVPEKNAEFALRVAQGVAKLAGRRIKIVLMGSGPLLTALQTRVAELAPDVDVIFTGHVSQVDIPGWFKRSRLFVFPTRWDPWGVVANEACMAGVPVLVSPHAGVAGELIRDGVNGRVLPLDINDWIDAAAQILAEPDLWAKMSAEAKCAVVPYSFKNAAYGIVDAARQAVFGPLAPPALSEFVSKPESG